MSTYGVNGYFGSGLPAPVAPPPPPPPMVPQAPMGAMTTPPPGAWPTPVTVPVNTAPNYGAQTGVDSYLATASQFAPYLAGAAPGRSAASKVGEAKSFFLKASKSKSAATSARASAAGRSAMFASIKSAVMSSVLVNGILSLAINGYKVATNKQSTADAGANVTGDLMSAAVGGAAGGVASAVGTFALAGILGTGFGLTLAGIGFGIVGYMVADGWLRNTQFFKDTTAKVRQMLA